MRFLVAFEALVAEHTTVATWWQQAQPHSHFFSLVFG